MVIAPSGEIDMSYCSRCGSLLMDDARFCSSCGASVVPAAVMEDSEQSGRVFMETHKCPSCGEPLGSFVAICPACGYELRSAPVSSAIQQFASKLRSISSSSERARFIQEYPVPNTREDLLEFLMTASSSMCNSHEGEELDAWRQKYEQCYQKAKLTLGDGKELAEFDELRQDTTKRMQQEEIERGKRQSMQLLMHPLVLVVAAGILVHEFLWLIDGNGFGMMNILFDELLLWASIKASIKLEKLRR